MSKNDELGDPADERLDTDFESFEEERQRSRMAKELKIGFGVIFVLLVVLAVVLYNRFSPAKESPAASAEAQGEELQEAPKFDPGASQPETSPAGWSPPTIVPAMAGPEGPSPGAPSPDAPPPSLDLWSAPVEDSRVAKDSPDATPPLSPSSLAPKLVSVAAADRYASYGDAEQAGAATPASQVLPSASVEAGETGYRRDPSSGAATASGSGDGQAEGSSGADLGGLHVPSTQVNLAPPPAFQQPSDSPPASTPEPNPLRTLTREAEPIGQSQPAPSPDAASQLGQPPEAFQGGAGPASMPAAEVGPAPNYPTASQPSELTQQADVSGTGSRQAVAGLARPSAETSGSGRGRQPWASGGSAIQSDPTRPSLLNRNSTLAGAGQQGSGANPSSQEGTYVVQPNDNYWAISEKLYGTGAYFRALAHHNRAKIPDEHHLQLGDVVLTPDASELHKNYPDLCPKPTHREAAQRRALAGGRQTPAGPGRVYLVQEGDNLFDIARHELGKATRWTEIVDLNRQVLGADLEDLNYLTPGMKLILPKDQPAGELTRRAGSLYQR